MAIYEIVKLKEYFTSSLEKMDIFEANLEGKRGLIDGNKENNSVDNLEWCDRGSNLQHAYRIGLRTAKGTKNSRCKLSEEDVKFIKANYIPRDKEYGARALSKRFGVAHQTISAVASGQNWKETSK